MKKFLFTATAIIGAVGYGVCAESTVQTDTLKSVKLQEVSVVANRATEKTPIAFSNVTGKEIGKRNLGQDIPYLLSMTPSVITTSDAGTGIGYTSLRVRGVDASRINVTANGVPINDSESHNVYWVNMPDLASSIKDVQIQRGAGTSTNGAGAFGASVNLLTTTPSRNAYAELNGSYGMYNTHKETLNIGTGLFNEHWAFDARLSNIGTDGYINRACVNLYSYFTQAGYYDANSTLRFIAYGGSEKTYHAWDYASKDEMTEYGRRYILVEYIMMKTEMLNFTIIRPIITCNTIFNCIGTKGLPMNGDLTWLFTTPKVTDIMSNIRPVALCANTAWLISP